MEQGLYNLILKTKEPSISKHRNGDATHMIYYPQQQFITIKRANFEEFWRGYCDLVYKGDGNYSIAEINTRDMPVLALLTFKFNKDNIGDLITLIEQERLVMSLRFNYLIPIVFRCCLEKLKGISSTKNRDSFFPDS